MVRRSIVVLGIIASSSLSAAEHEGAKDLVPAARQSLHGFMVRIPESVPGHEELYRVLFDCYGLPPSVGFNQWGWGDGTGRAVEAWLYAREMTGEKDFGRQVEQGQRALLRWLLVEPTGLACVPDLSHPRQGTYYYHMWDQGRVLRAMVRLWLAAGEPAEKADWAARINRMIAGLGKLAKRGKDATYRNYAVLANDVFDNGRPDKSFCPMSGGQLIEPLAMYWSASGDMAARTLADELCAGVLSGREADLFEGPEKRDHQFGPDGSFTGHFHNKASTVLGVARHGAALIQCGQAENGLRLLRWAKRVYDWTLSPKNVNCGSTWGWFPENNGDSTQARTIMEICCTADMIELAAVLAGAATIHAELADWDALWDHVERYTLNTILPSQFSITPRYRELMLSRGWDIKPAERLIGAWVGYHPPNDWVTFQRNDGRLEMLMGCCCNYSGLRGLYACWQSILSDDGECVLVRLPICRSHSTVVQTVVEGSDKVDQRIDVKADRSLRVRIPDWCPIADVKARTGDGDQKPLSVKGRWLDFGRIAKGTMLTITCPLLSRQTRETVGGDSHSADFTSPDRKRAWTVTWRGNRVVGMEPKGTLLPVFPSQ